jgi:hypothetical protein
MSSSGLVFRKFDFHVHTPASHDFVDKKITAAEIVREALSKGLSGIAITDHCTGGFVDEVKLAAEGTDLTVFPGVEIYCSGGEKGIHITAILDQDKDKESITALLSRLSIPVADFGKKGIATTESVFNTIDIIASDPINGIAILAHSNSSKGVLHDIKGETRTAIFRHGGLLAAEATIDDFSDETKKKAHRRVYDLLDGTDANYGNRKLAVIISSDSHEAGTEGHTLKGIGSQYSWLKVPEKLSLESIRQCFIDRDVRIRQSFETTEISHPHIQSMSIKGGFFDGETASFHMGLNTIVGSKGAGKSLLIEFLRFALDNLSTQEKIRSDHDGKLEKKLGPYGTILVRYVDEAGIEKECERTFDQFNGYPYRTTEEEADISIFRSLFLSQNEIISIAESETQQLAFIDRFFDFQSYQQRIRRLEDELSHHDKRFAKALRATDSMEETQEQIARKRREIEGIDVLLRNKIYDRYVVLEQKKGVLDLQLANLRNLIDQVNSFREGLEEFDVYGPTEPYTDDANIKFAHEACINIQNSSLDVIRGLLGDIQAIEETVVSNIGTWLPKYTEVAKEYQEHIQGAGGEKRELELRRSKLADEYRRLQNEFEGQKKERGLLRSISTDRQSRIDEINVVYKDYSDERKKKCSFFEVQSLGKLKVSINEASNMDQFKAKLLSLKRGSYIRDDDIESICTNSNPYDFVMNLLRYTNLKKDTFVKEYSDVIKIEESRLFKLFDYLIGQFEYEDLLALQYIAIPQDRPSILYNSGEEYLPISEVSTGQKCTAMLMMALGDGKIPIIIDQPEDSLDVKGIWDDMCEKIRGGKDQRQFIFTTHNSSLAVASDTDKYLVVEGTAHSGKVILTGVIDEEGMKNEIIDYLEGGKPTYDKKAPKIQS